MDYLSFSQASTIKEACKKASYWLACLFVSVSFITPTVVQATSKIDAEMANAYQLIFGSAFVNKTKKKPSTSNIRRKKLNKKAVNEKITARRKDPELVAFYQQIFAGTKPPKSLQAISPPPLHQKSVSPPILNQQVVEPTKAHTLATLPKNTKKLVFSGQNIADEEEESSENGQSTDLAALFAKAFGKKLKAGPSEITVSLRINEEALGDIKVYRNKQGRMGRAQTQVLLTLLEETIKEHIFKRIEKSIGKTKKVNFKKLQSFGIRADYNGANLSLDLEIKPNIRKPRILSMQAKTRSTVREENKITANEVSGYINMYSNLGIRSGGANNLDLSMKLESSLRVGKVVLENDVLLQKKSGS